MPRRVYDYARAVRDLEPDHLARVVRARALDADLPLQHDHLWRGGPRAVANPWRVADDRVAGVLAAADLQLRRGARRSSAARTSTASRARSTRCSRAPPPAAVPAGADGPAGGRLVHDRNGGVGPMRTILVVANETLTGHKLIARAREEAAKGPVRVIVCVPRKNPTHGNIIYADTVFEAAQVRVDLARGVLRELGIDAVGEVGDPDPYTATMDIVAEYEPDHIIVSTFPAASSGWLRRDFVERIDRRGRRPGRAHRHRPRRTGRRSTSRSSSPTARRTASALIRELRAMADAEPSGPRAPVRVRRADRGRRGHRASSAPRRGSTQVVDRARAARSAGRRHDRRPRPVHRDDERR